MVERKGATVDPELRDAFTALSGQIAGVATIARGAEAAARQTAGELAQLRAYVYGSKPPPPAPPADPDATLDPNAPPPPAAMVPLARQVADSLVDVDEVRGELDGFRGQVIAALARLEQETKKQSGALGVDVASFWKWLRTREGRMFVAATAAIMMAAASWFRPEAPAPRVEVVRVEAPAAAPAASLSSTAGVR